MKRTSVKCRESLSRLIYGQLEFLKKEEVRQKKISKEIKGQNFPNLMKTVNLRIQEAQKPQTQEG